MDLVNTYANVGEAILDNMQVTLDAQRRGYNRLTLTEIDTTTIPQIAAGSRIEVGGSLYQAASAESISGSATTGTNYIYLVPGTNVVTPAWTTTAPTWSDAKQGWYGTGGSAGYRYIASCEYDGASSYTFKKNITDNFNYEYCSAYGTSGTFTVVTSADIVLDNTEYDTRSGFDTGTYSYTVQHDGTYTIYGKIIGTNTSAGYVIELELHKNGSSIDEDYENVDSSSLYVSLHITRTMKLNKGDVLNLHGKTGNGTFTVAKAKFYINRLK